MTMPSQAARPPGTGVAHPAARQHPGSSEIFQRFLSQNSTRWARIGKDPSA